MKSIQFVKSVWTMALLSVFLWAPVCFYSVLSSFNDENYLMCTISAVGVLASFFLAQKMILAITILDETFDELFHAFETMSEYSDIIDELTSNTKAD